MKDLGERKAKENKDGAEGEESNPSQEPCLSCMWNTVDVPTLP